MFYMVSFFGENGDILIWKAALCSVYVQAWARYFYLSVIRYIFLPLLDRYLFFYRSLLLGYFYFWKI